MTKVKQAVAVAKQFTVDDVPTLLAKVTEQIAFIKKDIPPTLTATGNLDGFGEIAKIETVESLIKAHSSVVSKAKAYRESADAILPEGIKRPALLINGHSESAWVEAIKARVCVVANQAQLKKLEEVKRTLEANLSAEAKLAKDLENIANMLSDEN